jgi:hypothetical protein
MYTYGEGGAKRFCAIHNLSKEMAESTFQIGQLITKNNLLPIMF